MTLSPRVSSQVCRLIRVAFSTVQPFRQHRCCPSTRGATRSFRLFPLGAIALDPKTLPPPIRQHILLPPEGRLLHLDRRISAADLRKSSGKHVSRPTSTAVGHHLMSEGQTHKPICARDWLIGYTSDIPSVRFSQGKFNRAPAL